MAKGLFDRLRLGRSRRRPPAPFIVGVGRSGTTLMRLMLDSHPELAIPPETYFVPTLIQVARKNRPASAETLLRAITEDTHHRWGDFGLDADELRDRFERLPSPSPGGAIRTFYELYASHHGAVRWGDKTPLYLKRMNRIHSALDEAAFIHMIRDGRDVALSYSNRLRAMDPPREPPPIKKLARRWRRLIEHGRDLAAELPAYREVHYEQLVTEPERTLEEVCGFVELGFDPEMVRYHERASERLGEMARDLPAADGRRFRPGDERLRAHALATEPPRADRAGRWQTEMDPADVAAYESVAGDLLAELGYATGPDA